MIICVLAGGEGSRLWPLSTPAKPKQILNFTGADSLIQRTYTLMQNITKNIFVVSEKSHQHIILKQIKDFDRKKMIVEPCRKGTTNCVLLAARYIKNYFKGKKNNEKILFIHADHIFDNKINFISSIKGAFAVNVKGGIVIGGKKPTCAGTKYGYIETKKINNDLYKVNSFCEKPNQQLANKLYKKPNYFWNEGFFICTINDLANNLLKTNKEVHANLLRLFELPSLYVNKFYKTLVPSAIEKSLMEKSDNIYMFPINFSWVDLGTYNSLCSMLGGGNIIKGENIYEMENTNTFVHNSTNINVGVIGLDNVAVVLTNDGLLVLNKEKENLVSEITKKIK